MKRVIAWFKTIRPAKVLTAFVASVLLLLTQACNNPSIAGQPPQPSAQTNPGSESAYTDRYDPTKSYNLNTPSGGMNNFNDVDARAERDQRAADAKAKGLRDNAKRNVDEKSVDSVGQYVENYRQGTPFGQRVKNLGEDIGSSAAEVGEGVAKGTKRGLENIKDNTQNAAEGVSKNVQRAGEDAADNVKGAFR
ncbi:DUF6658 family protein [Calothrix sp. NIES-2098]|uniref:DUF6658 family protein n=1 Tax=Calothrix sp. NIES-2098 TaxID=1954171 RepID=UPI000B5F9574|nr:hypothetical protein NIES2098_44650 [Calothrix sp. NIES-2098]